MNNFNIQKHESQEIFKTLDVLRKRKKQHENLIDDILSAFKAQNHYTENKAVRMRDCGSLLELSPNGKIISANFCKNRFCPICQWRLSLKTFGKVAKMQDIAELENPSYQYIFVTFTIENTISLSEGLETVLKGFNNITHDRLWRKIQRGFIRSVEATYNDTSDTWHAHIHTVIAMPPEYFTENYMTNREWGKLWERNVRTNYTPVVDVRAIKADRYKAVAEVVKYAVKPFDLKTAKSKYKELYTQLLKSLYNRRLRSFGGLYKSLAKRVDLDGDMDLTDEDVSKVDGAVFSFKDGEYYLHIGNGQGVNPKDGEVIDLWKYPLLGQNNNEVIF